MRKKIKYCAIAGWIFCGLVAIFTTAGMTDEDKDRYLRLNIGTPGLKDKVLSISQDRLYDMSSGQTVEFSRMIDSLIPSRFIYVGETHNSLPMHQIQAKIIESLYEQDRNLSVGLEMYPVTQQEALKKWSLGILSEKEFIRDGQWYVNWNFHFGFYRDIFREVKKNAIPLYALNVPREIITGIRMKGWEALPEEERELVPKPDLTNQDHRTLIRTIFTSSDLPPQMKGKGLEMAFEGLYRAQTAWDETMARYSLEALEKEGGRIVVLAGSGHLLYNLGINLRAYNKSSLPFKTVVCVVIPEGEESVPVSRSLADYVWGLPEEERPAYPSVGLRFKEFDGLDNLVIERDPIDGVAKGSDFKKGDVLLSVDGKKFTDVNELRTHLAGFNWGEQVTFRLLRDAQEIEVILKFRMTEEDTENP